MDQTEQQEQIGNRESGNEDSGSADSGSRHSDNGDSGTGDSGTGDSGIGNSGTGIPGTGNSGYRDPTAACHTSPVMGINESQLHSEIAFWRHMLRSAGRATSLNSIERMKYALALAELRLVDLRNGRTRKPGQVFYLSAKSNALPEADCDASESDNESTDLK